jgi:hypothetical protein
MNKLKLLPISVSTYAFILSLHSAYRFIKNGTHTAFEWTTTQDIPFILRLIDSDFITNDFYTNSVIGSPRFLFSYFIYGFTLIGIDWYFALYFLKFIGVVIIPPLLFFTAYKIFVRWNPNLPSKIYEIVKFLLLLGFIGKMSLVNGHSFSQAPFGWTAIQTYHFVSPMTVSFIIGLIYNLVSFDDKKLNKLSFLLLLLSTLMHPVIGICHFIISVLFLLPISFCKKTISKFILDFIIGIFTPILILTFYFSGISIVNASIFIDYYIILRHPHHYLMSGVINKHTVKWVILFLIPVYYSIKTKDKNCTILSFLIFSSFIAAPIFQFLGTEIFNIKGIAKLGPSRFTAYASILWLLNSLIVGTVVYKEKKFSRSINKLAFYIQTSLSLFQRFLKKPLIIMFIPFLIISFLKTYQHPLDYYNKQSAKALIEWVSKNTSEDSVFFVRELDSFLIRVYGQRAIFADDAFPFNENYITEFAERFIIHKNSSTFQPHEYACLKHHYTVDYLIVPSKEQFKDQSHIFSSPHWVIYDIDTFHLEESCDKAKLLL